jgi:hypothetical protein
MPTQHTVKTLEIPFISESLLKLKEKIPQNNIVFPMDTLKNLLIFSVIIAEGLFSKAAVANGPTRGR